VCLTKNSRSVFKRVFRPFVRVVQPMTGIKVLPKRWVFTMTSRRREEEVSVDGTELKKIKLLLADVIDELAASEAKVNDLTFSLAVLKETAQSCVASGRFESEYKRIERVLAGKLQSTTQQGPKIASLLQIAQELRKEN